VFFHACHTLILISIKEYETQKDHLQNEERIYNNEEIKEATKNNW